MAGRKKNVKVRIRANKTDLSLIVEETRKRPDGVASARVLHSLFLGDLLLGTGEVAEVVLPAEKLDGFVRELEETLEELRKRLKLRVRKRRRLSDR